MLVYVLALGPASGLMFGGAILTSTKATIQLISKAPIYGCAITVAHIICRGAWRKYHSKFIVAVLIAGAVPLYVIWTLPNVGQQTEREVLQGHIGLSAIVIILCGLLLVLRWVFLKIFRRS